MGKNSLRILMVIFISSCQSQTGDKINYYLDADTAVSATNDAKNDHLENFPGHFGFGKKATATQISALDIDIRPDGTGLPEGKGRIQAGQLLFASKCGGCHGAKGEGGTGGRLVGIMGDTIKAKTIGNYWPYATTLFDYIRRAMPFNAPGSLHDDEVYDLTAYLLFRNKIIDSTTILNKRNLPKLVMPAKAMFVIDDRKGGPEIR